MTHESQWKAKGVKKAEDEEGEEGEEEEEEEESQTIEYDKPVD